MDVQKLVGEVQTAFAEFKSANDARLKAIEAKGYAPADLVEKVEKLNTAISEKEAEIAAIKTAMNRTNGSQFNDGKKKEEKEIQYEKAMKSYLRGGGGEVEMKALSSDSDQDGGFLVTPEMSSEVIKKVFETSEMRAHASQQTISTSSLQILEDLDEAGAGWVGEIEPRPETSTPQWKMIEIPVHEIYAEPKATQRFLDDASINVEAWLSEKVSSKFARTENTSFVSGDGVKKPKGFLDYASGTGFGQIEQVVTGHSTAILADSLIDLIYSVKSPYKAGSKFFMKRGTIKDLRKFKDLENRYLWAPGMDGNTAGSILGYEVVEFNDMPDVAANALPVAFGDMKQAYQIVDRIGIRVLRDPFTSKPFVKFYTTKRVGGGVKNFEALKLLKVSV
jgi:HK97 family phage major capsid protein